METTISDMTEKDLKSLIQDTVKETLDDYFEDMTALMSENYKSNIKESRNEYLNGETIELEALE